MTVSLLPSNATPWELAVSETSAERHDALVAATALIADLWDPWACTADFLPFLARAVGCGAIWDAAAPELAKRALIARMPADMRRIGTLDLVREWIALKGGIVHDAIVPPQGFYAGPSITPAATAAWLAALPELRVTLTVDEAPIAAVAAPRVMPLPPAAPALDDVELFAGEGDAIEIAGTGHPGWLVEILIAEPGETFAPEAFDPRVPDAAIVDGAAVPITACAAPRYADAPELALGPWMTATRSVAEEPVRTAVLIDAGVEREVIYLPDPDGTGSEMYVLPPAPNAAFFAGGWADHLYAAETDEGMRVARVRRADPVDGVDAWSAIALGAREPVSAAPEREMRALADPQVMYADHGHADVHVAGESGLDLVITERWRLIDPTISATVGPMTAYADWTRIDWPDHTAELLVEVHEIADPREIYAGRSFEGAFAGGEVLTPTLDAVRSAGRAAKALHDDLYLDTAYPPRRRMSDARTWADIMGAAA